MHFKINKTGCNVRRGLCEVRFDLFLDEGDEGFEEHYVEVLQLPPEGYPGAMHGLAPESMDDYYAWLNSLPKAWQHNPFCCHFCQFEPDVSDEEILLRGEQVLEMAGQNWKVRDLRLNKNPPVRFSMDSGQHTRCVNRVKSIMAKNFASIAKNKRLAVRCKG